MQANFYNVTGRLVPLHMIRDKCEGAERARSPSQGNGCWQRVERWVDAVEDDDLEDPAL